MANQYKPISEGYPAGQPANPYGRRKLMEEDMLRDLAASDPRWRITILRYFNPLGADESGQIGEDLNGIPNNLLLYFSHVAVGKLPDLAVFGDDYPTPDGTSVRDYIHVVLDRRSFACFGSIANPQRCAYLEPVPRPRPPHAGDGVRL